MSSSDDLAHDTLHNSQRRLGSSGLVVGSVAFGCWRFAGASIADSQAKIEAALDVGANLIDTADIYGFGGPGPDDGFGAAELLLGEVLAASPPLRDRMVVATKGGISPPTPYNSGGAALIDACEASLRRLGVDVIDLYQVHRPDLLAHPEEVAAALSGLVESGKVRHLGVSNYTPSQTAALVRYLPSTLVSIQPEFSLIHQDSIDDGTLDQAMELGLTPLAWSPLAGGRLTSSDSGDRPDLAAALDQVADAHDTDRDVVALAAVLAHPSRPVAIIGTQNLGRIRRQAAAMHVVLSKAEVYRLLAAAGRTLP